MCFIIINQIHLFSGSSPPLYPPPFSSIFFKSCNAVFQGQLVTSALISNRWPLPIPRPRQPRPWGATFFKIAPRPHKTAGERHGCYMTMMQPTNQSYPVWQTRYASECHFFLPHEKIPKFTKSCKSCQESVKVCH